ncbi:GNAT family N-acetyltransferase [Shewanella youngdeokensis]|uniref:GNAT family N-acetyltransferase n=1 Tax=Shewanella youngdeokensis TaxID=2999068 RepID=A0ABZ0K1S6_9GAMM|nr:GNAT family N-acetyltransferase [Shewanella sp. DAU334]
MASKTPSAIIRNITAADWPAILEIQLECYPSIAPESLAALQSKWLASELSCFSLQQGNQLVGYCLAHPWQLNHPPTLNQQIAPLSNANTLYLHDLALSASAQGQGAGKRILAQLIVFAQQQGYRNISLVAVQGAASYWQHLGFVSHSIDKDLSEYCADAQYMVYTL